MFNASYQWEHKGIQRVPSRGRENNLVAWPKVWKDLCAVYNPHSKTKAECSNPSSTHMQSLLT